MTVTEINYKRKVILENRKGKIFKEQIPEMTELDEVERKRRIQVVEGNKEPRIIESESSEKKVSREEMKRTCGC